MVGLRRARNWGVSNTLLDYIVLLPGLCLGLVIGLAFFWVFPVRAVPDAVAADPGQHLHRLRSRRPVLRPAPAAGHADPGLAGARRLGANRRRDNRFASWQDMVNPIVRAGSRGPAAFIMIVFLVTTPPASTWIGAGTEVIGTAHGLAAPDWRNGYYRRPRLRQHPAPAAAIFLALPAGSRNTMTELRRSRRRRIPRRAPHPAGRLLHQRQRSMRLAARHLGERQTNTTVRRRS